MTKKKPPLLAAQALALDQRVYEAKKLLLAAIADHQKTITSIRPPYPELMTSYEQMLKDFAECRGSKLWFPYIGSGIGNGALVELLDGSVKYDFISGIGVHYLGHSHPAFVASSIDAAIDNTVMQGNLQQNKEALELSFLLTKAVKMDHCFLTSSGAMANENALKIIFQKRFPANRVLAFDRNFAGRTLVLSQITDKASYREGLPETIHVDYVPFFNSENPEESTAKAVTVLKKHLGRYPKGYAGMCFEFVQGEGGFYPGSKEFFITLMKILREHHVSIFADEIQTFGRTPEICAFHYFELEEYVDIVSIGKMSQVCATLFKEDHCPRLGLLSQTFTTSSAAIHASLAIMKELLQGNYFGPHGKIMEIYDHFSKNLEEIAKKHPQWLKGPFGIGAMIAFTPFEGVWERTAEIVHALFDAGVISFIAGLHPTRIRFLVPPGAVTKKDIDHVCEIIEKTLEQFL